jgi:glycerophosphoryl diester phosphodiesterase
VWFLQRLLLPPLYRPPADAFLVPERLGGLRVLDAAFVRRARAHGMSVGVWTVNEPDDVTRLLPMGVRFFVTDDPERILVALGRPPPLSAR